MVNSSGGSWLIMLPFFIVSLVLFYVGFTSEQYLYFLGGAVVLIFPLTIILMINRRTSAVFQQIEELRDTEKREIEDLYATGTQATAKVLSLSETGRRINFKPQVRILLEISIPNRPIYQAQKIVALPVTVMPQVQPDSIIQVLVDPQQPQNEKRIGLLLK